MEYRSGRGGEVNMTKIGDTTHHTHSFTIPVNSRYQISGKLYAWVDREKMRIMF
jgi:hypothetical protein